MLTVALPRVVARPQLAVLAFLSTRPLTCAQLPCSTVFQELYLSTCPGRVVARAAKACPLRAVGIPVDPPCTSEELAEIIQASLATVGRLD